MADKEDEDLQMALRMSMQSSPSSPPPLEPKRSKPRELFSSPSGKVEEIEEARSRRVKGDILAAAAEKRMTAARLRFAEAVSSPPKCAEEGKGVAVVRNEERVERKGGRGGGGGGELSEDEANKLLTMVFGGVYRRRYSRSGVIRGSGNECRGHCFLVSDFAMRMMYRVVKARKGEVYDLGKSADGSWLWCTTEDTVYDAVKSMSQQNVGALVVVKPGEQKSLAGIITESKRSRGSRDFSWRLFFNTSRWMSRLSLPGSWKFSSQLLGL